MDLKIIFIILLIFFLADGSELRPSDEIWDKVKEYSAQGKMLNESKFYFVFDELNKTKLDIRNSKMSVLSNRQKEIYINYGLRNYAFIVQSLNGETIEMYTDNLFNYIKRELSPSLGNSIITCISIDDRLIRIKLGDESKMKYTDNNVDNMISNLGKKMRNDDFYGALIQLVNDIENYYGKQDYNGGSNNSGEADDSYLVTIAFIFVVVIVIIALVLCKRRGWSGSGGSYYYHSYDGASYSYHHGGGGPRIGGGGHHGGGHHGGGGGHHSGGGGGGGGGGHSGGRTGGW